MHCAYVTRKEGTQDAYMAKYSWLGIDPKLGYHCTICINSVLKSGDKLSTTGYGWTGEGDERVCVPIPAAQKLTRHQRPDEPHDLNVKRAEEAKSGKAESAKGYVTITAEDELCKLLGFWSRIRY